MVRPIDGGREALSQPFIQQRLRASQQARSEAREVQNRQQTNAANQARQRNRAELSRSVALRRPTELGFSRPDQTPRQRGGIPRDPGASLDLFA